MTQDDVVTPRPAALPAPARFLPGMPTPTYGGPLVPAVDGGLLPRGAPV